MEIAGHIAFTTLLALFPFLIFLVSVAGFVGSTQTGQDFIGTLALFAPPTVIDTLQPAIEQVLKSRSGGLLTIGLVLSLYSAGSGVDSLRYALNQAYGATETRPFWLTKAHDFMVVAVGSVVLIMASAVIILGPEIWHAVTFLMPVDAAKRGWWHIIRYAFTLIAVTIGVTGLHRALPNTHLAISEIFPGAIVTTIAWIAAASVLTLYFGRISDYTVTYGSLGGVIVTMLFFYVSGIIFIYGGELNAVLRAHRQNANSRQHEDQRDHDKET